jgi:hypothetical protein
MSAAGAVALGFAPLDLVEIDHATTSHDRLAR